MQVDKFFTYRPRSRAIINLHFFITIQIGVNVTYLRRGCSVIYSPSAEPSVCNKYHSPTESSVLSKTAVMGL